MADEKKDPEETPEAAEQLPGGEKAENEVAGDSPEASSSDAAPATDAAELPDAVEGAEAEIAADEADADEADDAEGDDAQAAGGGSARNARERRRQRQRQRPAEQIKVRAQAKYVRSSARKARLVCDHLRGNDVERARAILQMSPRSVARDWSKLLESAVANAEHNHALDAEDLEILAVYADEGPTIKRFQPRAQGRAFRIRKRTSHLTILLGSKE